MPSRTAQSDQSEPPEPIVPLDASAGSMLSEFDRDTLMAFRENRLATFCKTRHLNHTQTLKRIKRVGWTMTIPDLSPQAPTLAAPTGQDALNEIRRATNPLDRGRIYARAMGDIVSKTLPHLDTLAPEDVLNQIEKIERLNKVARSTFGLDESSASGPTLNVNILAAGVEQFAIQTPT